MKGTGRYGEGVINLHPRGAKEGESDREGGVY